jgi:hypothetical protein
MATILQGLAAPLHEQPGDVWPFNATLCHQLLQLGYLGQVSISNRLQRPFNTLAW